MGSYSVGGGPKKHTSLRESKGSSMKRTKVESPRSSYQAPSKTKPSQGIAQPKTAPIKDSPKVSATGSEDNYSDRNIPTTTTTTTTKPKDSKPISVEKKFGVTIKTRAQKLRDALYY